MYVSDKLYDEMKEIERQIKAIDITDAASITEYFRLYTILVYNYKWVGSLYDIYAGDVLVTRENAGKLIGADAVVNDTMQFLAAFPDAEVSFANAFAVPEDDDTYSVWRRFYIDGTNLGVSKYGPPTGKSLEYKKSMCLSMATVKNIDGKWRILYEKFTTSSEWIRQVCTFD